MDKKTVNLLIINGLKSKGRNVAKIDKDLLNDFSDILYKAISVTRCCTEFKCGQQRVFGEEKCIKQCSDCKLDYSDI